MTLLRQCELKPRKKLSWPVKQEVSTILWYRTLFPTRFHNVVILDWLNFFIGRSQLYKCLHCFDQPQSERKRPGAEVWSLRSTDINKNYVSENRGRKNARQELCLCRLLLSKVSLFRWFGFYSFQGRRAMYGKTTKYRVVWTRVEARLGKGNSKYFTTAAHSHARAPQMVLGTATTVKVTPERSAAGGNSRRTRKI